MAAKHSHLLSPLDQYMPVSYNRVFLAFTCASANHTSAITALKNSFQVTCTQLPYLKGRVYNAEQHGGRLAISWSEQDPTPPFQEIDYPANSQMPSYAQLKQEGLASNRLPQALCPVMGYVAASFPDGNAPVVAASYTLLDGGVLICLCVHHNVMDGTGTGIIISLWGRNTKGVFSEPLPDAEEPRHRLERLKASVVGHDSIPMNDGGQTIESLLTLHPEYTSVLTSRRPPFPPCTSKIFTFAVEKLKSAAIECKTSVNNVLCAIIWSCITSVRSNRWRNEISALNREALPTESKLGMAVNGRGRLGESFEGAGGRPYIGNVNLYSVTNLDLDHLIKLGHSAAPEAIWATSDTLAPVVSAITASIGRIDRQFISEVITIADQVPRIQSLQPGWSFFNGPDLTITSWANLDTYSADFGSELGMPDFVRLPYLEVDGLNIVLPQRRTSIPENIEVVIMLRKDDMAELERNAMWRYWTQPPNLTK